MEAAQYLKAKSARGDRGWRRSITRCGSLKVTAPGGSRKWGSWHNALHETDNWLVPTDSSNAFDMVNRTAVHAEVATWVSALTSF